MSEYNRDIASVLRTLADYVEMSDGDVKLRLGIQFKLRHTPVVRIPVLPAGKFANVLGHWAASEVLGVVQRYQAATGKTDGQDLIDAFSQATEHLKGIDKR